MSTSEKPFIHALADVQTPHVGDGTKLWQFVVALAGARIGAECNICSHCFIENDVVVGDRVTIKNGVQLWDGMRVGDDVFIGPNVTFTNDHYPQSGNREFTPLPTVIEDGVSIGAGAVFLPGLRVGKGAFVAAGSVVTSDVPAGKLVMGNPARIAGEAKNAHQ